MKLISSIMAVAAICLGMASCNTSGSSEYKMQQSVAPCINITRASDGEVKLTTGISYFIIYNFTAQTADVTIQGLKSPEGTSFGQLVLSNLQFGIDPAGWRTIAAQNATPDANTGLAPAISSFSFRIMDCAVLNQYFPLLNVSYNVNGVAYRTVPSVMVGIGETQATTADGANTYTSKEDEAPVYFFAIDTEKKTATLKVLNAQFQEEMGRTCLEVRDIPFTVSSSGLFSISKEGASQVYTGSELSSLTLNNNVVISDLTGSFDATNNLYLNFQYEQTKDSGLEMNNSVVVRCSTPTAPTDQN